MATQLGNRGPVYKIVVLKMAVILAYAPAMVLLALVYLNWQTGAWPTGFWAWPKVAFVLVVSASIGAYLYHFWSTKPGFWWVLALAEGMFLLGRAIGGWLALSMTYHLDPAVSLSIIFQQVLSAAAVGSLGISLLLFRRIRPPEEVKN